MKHLRPRLLADLANVSVESFLPFDLDAAFSSAVVLLLAATVDYSLIRNNDGSWLEVVHAILKEMIARGNLVAKFHASELQQLDENLKKLPNSGATGAIGHATRSNETVQHLSSNTVANSSGAVLSGGQFDISPDFLGEWNSDDGLNGDQLMALADSLDLEHLDWLGSLGSDPFQPFDMALPL